MKKWLLVIIIAVFAPFFGMTPKEPSMQDTTLLSPPGWDASTDYTDQQYSLEAINMAEAWTLETGSDEVTVAIIDTGIDTDHEEFSGRILDTSYNAHTNDTGITAVEDDHGHGTMVAGIIAAERNNATGIDGMTDHVGLMVIKANLPGEETFPSSYVADGIRHAVDHGANVINLSLGSESMDSGIRNAVEYAHENSVFVVAASGNDGIETVFYPAGYETTISVGSVDESLERSSFSNYGLTLDLVAPGHDIVTTSLDDTYSLVSGTSFSAPHVSAALALLLSFEPDISYAEAIRRLETTAMDLGEDGKDIEFGHGLLDVYALLTEDMVRIELMSATEDTYEPLWVENGSSVSSLPAPEKEGHTFVGWFYDIAGQTPWHPGDVFDQDTILYAVFSINTYTVSFVLDGDLYATRTVEHGQTVDDIPGVSIDGYVFSGWFDTDAYVNGFDPGADITDDRTVYGKTTRITHTVTFLSHDESILDRFIVNHGEDLMDPPEEPERMDDDLFSYSFSHWDHGLTDITGDLTVHPVYDRSFLTDNATLSPGVDTIKTGRTWTDAGVDLGHQDLSVETSGMVDTDTPGTYAIDYAILYESAVVHRLTRMVTVLETKPVIEITLRPGITTVLAGTAYQDAGATSDAGVVETTGEVDVDTPGQYIITYTVSHDGVVARKHRYVYVLGDGFDPLDVDVWHERKDDDDDA